MKGEPSDAEVVLASVDDPAQFRRVVERLGDPLLRFFYRRTFDAEVSLDLVAETLAVAFERRHRYRDTGAPASAWVFGIARRELSRYRRSHRANLKAVQRLGIEVPHLDDLSIERIEHLVDSASFRDALAAALAELSSKEREAIRLRVLEELPYPEVALSLGCSENAARVRVHRGLTRLSHLLEVTP